MWLVQNLVQRIVPEDPSPKNESRRVACQQAEELPSIRVLVVGDAAVGKTALLDMICHGKRSVGDPFDGESHHNWTCGGALSLQYEVVEVAMQTKQVEVEFLEVGGTHTYADARSLFYDCLDAVLLVYDVSNMKSYHNLVMWLFELCTSNTAPSLRYWDGGGGSGGVPDTDIEYGQARGLQEAILSGSCPVLFVAHKCDLRTLQAAGCSGMGNTCYSMPRPRPPEKPPMLDRFLGGEGIGPWRGAHADPKLIERLCDFVQQGRHTEASSVSHTFDYPLWRDFVRRVLEAKPLGSAHS